MLDDKWKRYLRKNFVTWAVIHIVTMLGMLGHQVPRPSCGHAIWCMQTAHEARDRCARKLCTRDVHEMRMCSTRGARCLCLSYTQHAQQVLLWRAWLSIRPAAGGVFVLLYSGIAGSHLGGGGFLLAGRGGLADDALQPAAPVEGRIGPTRLRPRYAARPTCRHRKHPARNSRTPSRLRRLHTEISSSGCEATTLSTLTRRPPRRREYLLGRFASTCWVGWR